MAAQLLATALLCWLQVRLLREGVDIVVGTPGRVLDFVESGKIPLDQVGSGWRIQKNSHHRDGRTT
jgi:hypothetical protein